MSAGAARLAFLRFAALSLVTGLLLVAAPTRALADGEPVTASGTNGQQLTVSATDGLAADGQTVSVSGRGYDPNKGIYVAFCVVPPDGQVPSPCGGGVAPTGNTQSSAWISSHPPTYGQSLAKPYGDGGTFSLELRLVATLNDTTDCRQVKCAVVTRADHTRTEDRSQDVIVPVSFASPASPASSHGPLIVGIAAAGAIVLAAGGWLLGRRHRQPPAGPEPAPVPVEAGTP